LSYILTHALRNGVQFTYMPEPTAASPCQLLSVIHHRQQCAFCLQ